MEDLLSVFKALSDENRYRIIKLLLESDYCVKALSHSLGISESAISQHIKILKNAKILTGRKKGYFMHYSVRKDVLKQAGVTIINLSETSKQPCGGVCSKSNCKGDDKNV